MFNSNRRGAIPILSAFVMTCLIMSDGRGEGYIAGNGEIAPGNVAGHMDPITSNDTYTVVIDNDNGTSEVDIFE